MKKKNILSLMILLFLTFGCSSTKKLGIQLSVGESTPFHQVIMLIFSYEQIPLEGMPTGSWKLATITPDYYHYFTEDYKLSITKGFSINNEDLELYPFPLVNWNCGNYSINEGYAILIDVTGIIRLDFLPSYPTQTLTIILPGVTKISELLKAYPYQISNTDNTCFKSTTQVFQILTITAISKNRKIIQL